MLISSVTAGLIAPALWGSVGNMAAGMGMEMLALATTIAALLVVSALPHVMPEKRDDAASDR